MVTGLSLTAFECLHSVYSSLPELNCAPHTGFWWKTMKHVIQRSCLYFVLAAVCFF